MSTANDETRIGGFPGNCFRCGEYGHTADSTACEWLQPAANRAQHEARIDSLIERWQQFAITRSQKREYIAAEIEQWQKERKTA